MSESEKSLTRKLLDARNAMAQEISSIMEAHNLSYAATLHILNQIATDLRAEYMTFRDVLKDHE